MATSKPHTKREVIPPIARLHFNKGDLIIKEGDYGLSVYEIIEGKVSIYSQTEEMIIPLAELGPGEIFGEMAFLTGNTQPRAASARAMEDTILDAWHPKKLTKEYGEMPPIVKYIANQTLNRLIRINRLISNMGEQKVRPGNEPLSVSKGKRSQYRKRLDSPCTYRPLSSPGMMALRGTIKDISLNGTLMEVRPSNFRYYPHETGDTLVIHTRIPPDRDVELVGKIEYLKEKGNEQHQIGISFVRLSEDARRKLGFFLMPTPKTDKDNAKRDNGKYYWP